MLKSLELVGFKSFADRTRFEFPPGVTVVVGPNGSGKSNVVDAVRWVLGSQSPRSLRGAEMTDVIFSGSESRGSLQTAEVSLAFDNRPSGPAGRRLFDLDEEEVRLTRRVHRSGEGEYLVNGRACRLKDFRELLAGTGIGSESYSIIEQGRVDAALRASPLERRLLLEEAAGVSRFRLKKREAARRLERVEQNLLRLSDIVDEVEGRLRRVRAQAGKARRYREASLRLKEVRTELAAAEHRQLTTERRRLEVEHAAVAERASAVQAEAATLEQRLATLGDDPVADRRAERLAAEGRKRLARAERDGAVALGEAQRLADQRRHLLDRWLEARRKALATPLDSPARAALEAAERTAAEYETTLQECRERIVAAESRRAALAASLDSAAGARQRVGAALGRASELLAGLARRRDAAEASLAAVGRDRRDDEAAAAASRAALERASAERDAAADKVLGLDAASSQTQRDLAAARRRLADEHRTLGETRERLVGLRHRHDTIAREQRRLERLSEGVTGLVRRASAGPHGGMRVGGLVADLIHVEADFAPLVEAALGERAEHVVIDSRRALWAALSADDALGELATRAGFEPLDATAPATAADQVDLRGEPGVLGRAAEFVEVEPRHAGLVRRLFGRCWFVDTLATATRLAETVGRGLTYVTLGGETLSPDGTLVCGPTDEEVRLLTRREDGAALAAQIAIDERRVEAAGEALGALEREIEAAERRLADLHADAKRQRDRLAKAAQHAAALEERRRQAELDARRVETLGAERRREVARLVGRQRTLSDRHARLEQLGASQSEPAEAAEAELRRLDSERAADEARRSELAAAAARHAELLASLRREARERSFATDDESGRLDEVVAEADRVEAQRAAAELRALAATSAVAGEALAVARAEADLAQSRAARRVGERIRVEVVTALAQHRAEGESLARSAAEIDLRRQRLELEARAVAQRVRDDYGVDVAALPARETPLTAAERQSLRDEADRLRAEVQGIGPVSVESLEELDELETRFATLSSQYQDLSQAKQSLARLTARIDVDSRELFRATYEAVREQFRELFARLFGGGEADLLLVEGAGGEGAEDAPDGALGGGVEVVACPPGKELRSLSLLSGGEKTMTCVALLLALFRSRPSPFCLLDEVDAALDEANVGRFTSVLKDFLGSTQFIVVTHSKRTMASADTVYGVTMQESGVSKQISVRFEDVSEDGRIRLRTPETSGGSGRLAA